MSLVKETVANNQFRALLVCTSWPTVINYGSSIVARRVGRDMWLSGIISVLFTLIFLYIIIYIGRSYPDKSIIEYSQDLLWTIPGKILGFLLTVFFLFCTVNTAIMYIHHLTDFLLPETPFLVVTILHVAIITYLVWKGPEVIIRMGVIGFTTAIIFHLLVLLASVPEIDFSRLKPIADTGILEIGKASFLVDSFIGINQMIIAMIFPMILNKKKAFSTCTTGLLIGGTFFILYFIAELMVMGPHLVSLFRIASMDFVRSIQITQYLHRFESFMVALWYWSIFVQTGILYYCSFKAFIQTFGIKKEKPKKMLIFIFGAIITILTYYIGNDRIFFQNYREYMWHNISIPIEYGLPIFLLIVLVIRKAIKGGSKKKQCKN